MSWYVCKKHRHETLDSGDPVSQLRQVDTLEWNLVLLLRGTALKRLNVSTLDAQTSPRPLLCSEVNLQHLVWLLEAP